MVIMGVEDCVHVTVENKVKCTEDIKKVSALFERKKKQEKKEREKERKKERKK